MKNSRSFKMESVHRNGFSGTLKVPDSLPDPHVLPKPISINQCRHKKSPSPREGKGDKQLIYFPAIIFVCSFGTLVMDRFSVFLITPIVRKIPFIGSK